MTSRAGSLAAAPVAAVPAGERPPGEAAGPPRSGEARDLRTLARGGTLGLVGVVISAAFQFLLVMVVTRGLGATGAGMFLEAVALFTILANLAQFGANTGLVRSLPRSRALGRTGELRRTLMVAVLPVLGVSMAAAAGLYAFAPGLAHTFFHGVPHDAAVTDLRLFALALPLAPATIVLLSATRGLGTMVPYVFVQNIGLPVLRLVLVLAVVSAGFGTAAVAMGWVIPTAVAFAVGMIWLIRLLRRAERRDAEEAEPARGLRELASEFWRFSAARGLAGVLGMTVTWTDILLIGALRSTREAGIYAAASRLSIAGAYALQAVGMAIAPQISALLAHDRRERVETVYRFATYWLMALTWPAYMALLAFAPFVMGLFGAEFVAGHWALVILCVGMLVNLATGNVTVVLLMSGRSGLNLANACVSLVLNATLNLLLIPRMGMTGAAIAWTASLVYINVAPLIQVRLFLGVRPPFGAGYVLVALAAAACYGALGFATRYTLGMSAATFVLFCVLGTGIYGALLYRFRSLLHLGGLRQSLQLRRARAADAPAA
jgi:O-antigen/teichoic acid export membrane protein